MPVNRWPHLANESNKLRASYIIKHSCALQKLLFFSSIAFVANLVTLPSIAKYMRKVASKCNT